MPRRAAAHLRAARSIARRLAPAPVKGSLICAGLALGTALAVGLGACGSSQTPLHTNATAAVSVKHRASASALLRARTAATLPAGVQLPAVAASARGAIAVGGLDSSDSSVANIVLLDGAGTRTVGQLPLALHDAAAAEIDGRTYMFGGGEPGGTSAAIFRVGPSGAQQVGTLPVGASDIAAATVGHTAYVVGGYTTATPLRTIVAFTPGAGAHVVATIPRPLRYAAVASLGDTVLIAGGTSGETTQRAILSFDPATRTVRRIGSLPYPLTHAAGASLDGWFYVIGGRGESLSERSSSILAIDPRSGAVHRAGRLPEALSDIGATAVAGHILAVGGRTSAGGVSDRVLALLPGAR